MERDTVVRVRPCKYGNMLYFPHDVFIGNALDAYGEYSDGEVDLFRRLLKPGHIVVEVGANMGSLTVPLAQIVGNAGRVFAFEPQRIMFQQLCANVAMNAIFNVWTYNCAVGDKAGTVGLPPIDYTAKDNFGGVEMRDYDTPEMVPLVRLDDYAWGMHFLKIDVEGMELDVICGAREKIKAWRPVIYLENDREAKASAVIRALLDMDFDLYWHAPLLFNKDNFRGNGTNLFQNIASLNMLCIPSEYKIQVNGLLKITSAEDRYPSMARPTC